MLTIETFDAFNDNYIYIVSYRRGACLAVDPGDAGPVEGFISRQNSTLTHILATHHHQDHIGGIDRLKKRYGCEVLGSDKNRIPAMGKTVSDNDTLEFGDLTVRCIATPGHTSTGVCYFMTGKPLEAPVLFSGDTLFVCGCGRLFECDGKTMFASLQKIAALPEETRIYPGHNYTEENLRFALTLEPDSAALKDKLRTVRQQNQHGRPTVPSTLAEEKQLNPFLKAKTWQEFTERRRQKDMFG